VTSLPRNPHHLAYVAWVAVCLIWGTTYFGIRIALETIPPGLLGGLRYTIAGVVLAMLLVARGERLPRRAHWGGLVVLGFLMITLGNGGVIVAEQWVPSGIAAVIVAAGPFWITGIEALRPDGERISLGAFLGLAIGFAGILLLVWPELRADGATGRQFAIGVVSLQIACIGWALGSSYSRRHAREENVVGAAAIQMIVGGLSMLIAGTAMGEWARLTFTARTVAAELYLIAFGSLAAYSAYVYALKYLPVSMVSLYAYINPVIAVILGTALLGEPFGWRVVAGSAIVLAGVAVVRWSGRIGVITRGTARRAAA
jgi:drug/metabolite transporter (DMT)-like permease